MNNVFEDNVDSYEQWFEENNFLLDSEVEAISQLMPKEPLKKNRAIEIGAGTGIFSNRLGIGQALEPSLKMREKAKEKGIVIYPGVAESMDFPNSSYDLALMVTVDCFLNDIKKSFDEVWRILSDKGIFIIAFIDRDTTLGKIYEEKKEYNEFYKNANFNSSQDIIKLLKDAGFEIIDSRQTIYNFSNKPQIIKKGLGEGVFAVIKAVKIRTVIKTKSIQHQ